MDISIIFPTYNGEKTIRYTLNSLVEMDTSGISWEVLVCNNNSTDNTAEIIAEYKDKLPIRVYNETIQGMSASLNCLLKEAQGNLIVMTNDDVILSPGWAKGYKALADEKKDYDIFGGKIVPHFLAPPPFWFEAFKYKHVAFAMTPKGLGNKEVGPGSNFGPSMAIRKETLNKGVRFDLNIGPNGGEYEMGCESDFLSRLAEHGYKCWLSNDIILEHIIRPFQFNLSWISKRGRRYGLSMYKKEKASNFSNTNTVMGTPLWRINLFLKSLIQVKLGSKNTPGIANAVWEVGFFKGFLTAKNKN